MRIAGAFAIAVLFTEALFGAAPRLTVDEALRLAFPGCTVERSTVFLDAVQARRIEERSGSKPTSLIAHPYRARCAGQAGGTAYFDAHTVRTLPETLMIVVDPAGNVRRVEVLSFLEPPEYLPRDSWYRQFDGKTLDEELSLRRAIRPVAGASLTARSTTEAVRRTLALHAVVHESAPAGEKQP